MPASKCNVRSRIRKLLWKSVGREMPSMRPPYSPKTVQEEVRSGQWLMREETSHVTSRTSQARQRACRFQKVRKKLVFGDRLSIIRRAARRRLTTPETVHTHQRRCSLLFQSVQALAQAGLVASAGVLVEHALLDGLV